VKKIELILLIALIGAMSLRWWPSGRAGDVPDSLRFGSTHDGALDTGSVIFSVGSARDSAQGADTIVIFTDFYCPFCRRLSYSLDSVEVTRPLLVALRHWPILELHPSAFDVAVAFECAARQVDPRRAHDVFFHEESLLVAKRWDALAQAAAVPSLAEFSRCRGSGSAVARVRRDGDFARSASFRGTPTVLLDDRAVNGALSASSLSRLLSTRQ
jgi:protein-disulfide isomerase